MAHQIVPLIPVLREKVQTIRQQVDVIVYAGLGALLSLRDRNLILAELDSLRAGFLAIGESAGDAINAIDAVLQKYDEENGGAQ